MKVIKRGKEHQALWRGKCSNCGSIVEAVATELKITQDQRDGPFAWHKCPVCKAGDATGYHGVLFYPVKEVAR